jgi:hypothetical protein
MEDKIGHIIDKVETALDKMANVEKYRSIRMESMNKILDTIIDSNDGCKFYFFNVPHFLVFF